MQHKINKQVNKTPVSATQYISGLLRLKLPVEKSEIFKAENVEYSDRISLVFSEGIFFGQESVVHLQHDPVE